MDDIYRLVSEAWDNAAENGYEELLSSTAVEIAYDMIAYDEDIGNWWSNNSENTQAVINAVIQYRDSSGIIIDF